MSSEASETDSGIFRIDPARHAAAATRRLVARYAWVGLPVYGLLAWAGLRDGGDIRFAIVALIVTFMVYPMLLAFAWMAMIASPEARRACLPQRWELSPQADGIDISYYDSEATVVCESEHIAAADLAAFSEGGRFARVALRDGRELMAPADSLTEALRVFLLAATDEPLA